MERVTVVLVHGLPETSEVWKPLRKVLGRNPVAVTLLDRTSVAVELPGFGTPRPHGFTATKDAYAEWLAEVLRTVERPVDVVGHDIGAALTMRVATALDVRLRSWIVDTASIFHPKFVWPDRVRKLLTPEDGGEMLGTSWQLGPTARRDGPGATRQQVKVMEGAHDRVMSQSALDFYCSAIPNVAADWWKGARGPTKSRGMVLLLQDHPEGEAMSLEVASRLGAKTVRLYGLNRRWMVDAPEMVAPVLEQFWSSLH